MDTSETYIKMRLAAIPDLGRGKSPSLALSNDGFAWVDYAVFIDRLGSFYYSRVNLQPLGEELKACQLERQDQLQEMLIPEPYFDYRNLLSFFFDWIDWNDDTGDKGNYKEGGSMEQLWLAFVMKENHSKIWSDGWVLSV